ncbi:sensor histidine kinase [Lactiplantibacillus garii]|nr:HAMP domain-containing sensor histidine kinase [Lactiplantibacillus garii]
MLNFIKGRSNAAEIARTFTVMMLIIIFITGLSVSTVVGWRLTHNRMDDAATLMKSLQRSVTDDDPDWNQWNLNSPINTKDTYVKVDTATRKRGHHTYYSPRAKKFLKARELTVPGFPAIRYRRGYGLFYRLGAEKKRVYYETWTSLNTVIHIFKLILGDMLLVLMICGVLGYFVMGWLAKRLNRPLADLTRAASRINHAENVSYHEALPVPDHPAEVHHLGLEINELLQSLNEQVLRDHQFVSDASHELRTPLTAIRGHISLIKRRGEQHPEIIPRSLNFIDHESHRMETLVESLLRLSRMDHVDVAGGYYDLTKLVEETVTNYRENLPQPIRLHVPPSALTAYVNADSLQQILVALLSNASKYSPTNAPITVTLTTLNGQPTVTVADRGMGIPDDNKPHVFERFYRVDQARSQEIPGTGLGLAIVARLVDLNHATISVHDNQPRGTIFTLQLATTPPVGA